MRIFSSICEDFLVSKTEDWGLRTDVYLCLFLQPGCNKLYKCVSQKIGKQCIFVAGRLRTAVLLQKPWFTAFLSRMSRKTQDTRLEVNILRKFANEDKLQVLHPWYTHTQCLWAQTQCLQCLWAQTVLKHNLFQEADCYHSSITCISGKPFK